ncbi:sensor histidine kinase [Streptosporangium sp. NPDC004379]|uniref:sensor histidine kinase n=1 Tax=Streptosporangium sp. NPDC004379 TaxID=3366189 RepID=UPI003683BA0B
MNGPTGRVVRAAVYQALGAALLTPVAVVLGLVVLAERTPARVLALWAVCLPAAALLAAVPLVRRIEAVALQELLDVEVPPRADRLYLAALTGLHLYGGATLGAGVLLLSPGLVRLGDVERWSGNPAEAAGTLALTAVVLALLAAAGLGQRWTARRLLRAEPSGALEELGRRQSLALELHDSVGHALSVVLVQGMAAQAALRRPGPDPEPASESDLARAARRLDHLTEADAARAARSLDHLVDAARSAQEQLDVVLGVLDDGDDAARTPTLGSLHTLTRGLDVRVSAGRLDGIPETTSRAAYAIAREALTNALRHGRGPITLDVAVAGDLVLTVENAAADTDTDTGIGTDAGSAPAGRRRGLLGMHMRARLAGGTCTLERADATWRVRARLPL